jgi:hypothetical protein
MKAKKDTKYEVVVCVKDTNNENGPGHVSGFTRKTQEDETTVNHTSFFPGAIGSLLNAITFGSIPVVGQLAPNHTEDLQEADHVLVSQVSEEQYENMKKAQIEFSEEVDNGRATYSVFGTSNPLANLIPSFLIGGEGAKEVMEQHIKDTGCLPPEDHCGIHVYSDDKHPELTDTIKVHNCASSVSTILQAGGFNFDNPKIPTFFTSALKDLGFEEVDKNLFGADDQTGIFKTK